MEKATALLIHGAGGGAWEYDRWVPVFTRAGYRCIAHDLTPAKGGLEATHLTDYVRQVTRLAPASGPVVLVGASLGGILALKAAEHLLPTHIVLVNSVPPRGVGPARTLKPYPPIVRWANGPLKDTRDSMPDSDEATIQWAWKRWRDESGAVLNALTSGIIAGKPRCPVLCVLGENDTDVPLVSGLALARWAGADVHLYHQMSHVGPLLSTRAPEVARAAAAWCRRS